MSATFPRLPTARARRPETTGSPRARVETRLANAPATPQCGAPATAVELADFEPRMQSGAEARVALERGEALTDAEWSPEAVLETYGPTETLDSRVEAALDCRFMQAAQKGGFDALNRVQFMSEQLRPALARRFGIGVDDVIPFVFVLTPSVMGPLGHAALSYHSDVLANDPEQRAKAGTTHLVMNALKVKGIDHVLGSLATTEYAAGNEEFYGDNPQRSFMRHGGTMSFGILHPRAYEKAGLGTPEEVSAKLQAVVARLMEQDKNGKLGFFLPAYRPVRALVRAKDNVDEVVNCGRAATLPLTEAGVLPEARLSPFGAFLTLKAIYGDDFIYLVGKEVPHANPPGKKIPQPPSEITTSRAVLHKLVPWQMTSKQIERYAPDERNTWAHVVVPGDAENCHTKERYMLRLEENPAFAPSLTTPRPT